MARSDRRSQPASKIPDPALEERIRLRAYELYEARGREDGRDRDDWLQAEGEILGTQRKAARRWQCDDSFIVNIHDDYYAL